MGEKCKAAEVNKKPPLSELSTTNEKLTDEGVLG